MGLCYGIELEPGCSEIVEPNATFWHEAELVRTGASEQITVQLKREV